MKKKILALCLVVVLAITAVTGATLAYFTDVDQNTNEFTVGSLKIDLWEDVKHTNGLDEVIFEKTAQGKGDDTNPNIKYENIMPGDTMEKVVTVENKDDYDAYIALVIKQEKYLNFNQNIDDYYEGKGYDPAAMQEIIDDVFPGWELNYAKDADHIVRYMMNKTGEEHVLGYGYANYSYNESKGGYYYNYAGEYYTNDIYQTAVPAGEPDFMSIGNLHDRVWIIYLMVPAGESYTVDLTTVCPTYFDNNSVQAFADMKLDVKAFAIQTKGLEEKEAFAEALKPGFGF